MHAEPRVGLDLRVAVPDGVGATLTFARGPRLVFGVGLATALGTVAVTPEVTFAVRPASRCTPTLTAKASTIVFTPLMDGVINDQLAKIYGDQVTVAMAGRAMEVFQGLAGVDCALGGAHLVARAGYAWEPFGSVGGDNGEGDLDISNWHGPAIDLGLRWRIR
ncbi:MAG TPA: hypothetical protein VHE35_36215 [Kofleriaceae bacterium]|nr:hypothetical protein [Kofleriaceae bacterium]